MAGQNEYNPLATIEAMATFVTAIDLLVSVDRTMKDHIVLSPAGTLAFSDLLEKFFEDANTIIRGELEMRNQ